MITKDTSLFREIPITEIENVKIGNAEDPESATGVTVILCEQGAPCGLAIRGGGPAARESGVLDPIAACQEVHAVVLAGGSAFGLDAAGGVMEYLEERGYGFALGDIRVPIVPQSDIFDLMFVTHRVRPDKAMAKRACEAAEKNCPAEGNVGAGCGATVGKLGAPADCMNSGLGLYAVQMGELKIGAVVAVNALGDVYDEDTGKIVAGALTPDHKGFADGEKLLYQAGLAAQTAAPAGAANTTIGCIITNAKFDKPTLTKIAQLTHNGYARAIRPVHTQNDGDSIYALSVGDVAADIDLVGTLSARVMQQAILNAVLHTESFHGLPAAKDLAF